MRNPALSGRRHAALALACVSLLLPQAHAQTAGVTPTGQAGGGEDPSKHYRETMAKDGLMELEEAFFWDHSATFDGSVASSAACTETTCGHYTIDLADGGARLRVGIATAERTDTFVVDVFAPDGSLAGSTRNTNQFNSEAFIEAPAAGTWTILVRPEAVTRASYRLRAKLEYTKAEERLLTSSENRRPLYPNLRTVPPFEFTFTAPLNPLNGLYPPDAANPPASVAGQSTVSCTADEAAPHAAGGADAVHCLRLTSGPINIGEGIYDMRFRLIDDFIAGTAQLNPEEALSRVVVGDMQQAVHYTDGSVEFIQAGSYSFHPTHGHFHDDYILSYYLYKVTDPQSGELTKAGAGSKSGFCPADQLWGNWEQFNQGTEVPGGDSPGGNCFSPNNGVMGLSVGWGDIYRWQRPGQYVEFAGQGNGRYVVQAMVDEYNNVIELDETDNVSYAYLEIQGETIEILERGWGESPWDSRKVVFSGPHPTQRDESAPALAGSARAVSVPASAGGSAGWLLLGLLGGAWRRRAGR